MNASVPPTAVPDSNRSSVAAPCIALVGNPNVGKTSLFNRLTNLLAKTSNFAGTTVEVRTATISLQDRPVTLVDLPGLYSLDAASPEERIAGQFLRGELPERGTPSAMVVIVDAGQMERTLFVVRQALEIGLPILIVVNMTDTAAKQGIRIDYKKLSLRLGVPVVPVSARTGDGFDALQDSLAELIAPSKLPSLSIADESCDTCGACRHWLERSRKPARKQPTNLLCWRTRFSLMLFAAPLSLSRSCWPFLCLCFRWPSIRWSCWTAAPGRSRMPWQGGFPQVT
jgi:ferrous iron transport protein B